MAIRTSAASLALLLILPYSVLGTTVDLMTTQALGAFEDEGWEGYACTFSAWTTCVNSTSVSCADPDSMCRKCVSKRTNRAITCSHKGNQTIFDFPAGGVFPVTEQFTIPFNTAIIGAQNPNRHSNKAQQQVDIQGQTWFIVPKSSALCGDDPLCKDSSAKAPSACSGDPRGRRQGFLMSSQSTLKNVNFQGADLGRAGSEGTLCGPGAIELPGCLSGNGCAEWGGTHTTGNGVVSDVVIQNVRLSDAVKRAELSEMVGNCRTGEALDSAGHHVRAHQVSVWVAKLPDNEATPHTNILIDNLVSMNSRADGLNVHGAMSGLILQHSHIENSGDDCIGVWGTGIENMIVRNTTTANCAVTAGKQGNWGSCIGTYAFTSLSVESLRCFDPFLSTKGCNARTHFSAIHLNHQFANDCMPKGASLSLADIQYFASANPDVPLSRPKCGQCRSCCGGCSYDGFDNLTIAYQDASVPEGSCMVNSAGC